MSREMTNEEIGLALTGGSGFTRRLALDEGPPQLAAPLPDGHTVLQSTDRDALTSAAVTLAAARRHAPAPAVVEPEPEVKAPWVNPHSADAAAGRALLERMDRAIAARGTRAPSPEREAIDVRLNEAKKLEDAIQVLASAKKARREAKDLARIRRGFR